VSLSFSRRSGFFALLILLCCSPLSATIRYDVFLNHPEKHLFHVIMTIPHVQNYVDLQIPAWNALYQVRDFAAHVRNVEARLTPDTLDPAEGMRAGGNSRPVLIRKLDKQTWRLYLNLGREMVTATYDIYWDEPGPFATQFNPEHAFINPAMILMYVPDRRSEAVIFDLDIAPAKWQGGGPGVQLAQPMNEHAQNFSAKFASYDELADSPVELGHFEQFQLPGMQPEISVVVHGDNFKKKQIESELKRICEYEIGLMGGAPYPRYTFIFHIGKAAAGAGGGMEHSNATAISVPSGEYLASVAAHEFFHLWNVKRIRPDTLYPVDYTKEQYTRALWFAEGVTNTYGSYALARSGIWSKQQFYHDLGEQITELEARPANHWQSVEESSLDAWLEKYPLYNSPEYSVSYYTKGQILGVLLDILMRDRTDNGKSLDDLMRAMNKNFALAGKNYHDSTDIQSTAESIAGGSFDDFFKHYVAGSEPLPYHEIFSLVGLELREAEQRRATLGFSGEFASKTAFTVRGVDADGPAAQAGLQVGDVILRWNGGDPPRRLNEWIRQQKPGDLLHLRVRREGTEADLDIHLGEMRETFYDLAEDSHAGEKARRIRDGLLRGVTDTAASHAAR
jgi:predicted metalloprotease with PDZ domain